MRTTRSNLPHLLFLPVLLIGAVEAVRGEDGRSERRVEEIVVTAQKREQAIEDVPISMSVIDDELIAEQGLTDMHEAMLFVPNVKIDVAGMIASARIRGFTFHYNNKGFEPPAGFALDGVVYTRFGYLQSALLDVERIEILRGPQGTTFGKNTTAGLIDVITKNPTDEFAGSVSVQLGERDRRRLEAAVGGPIVKDLVNFRLAVLADEEEGFVENTTAAISPRAAERLRSRDNKAFRAKLAFPSFFGSELMLAAELAELEDGGGGPELWRATPETTAVFRGYDPNVDLEKGNFRGSIDDADRRQTSLHTFRADWRRDVVGWDVRALAAHSIYEEDIVLDNDYSPVPALVTNSSDTSPTTTFEVRGVSPRLEGLFGVERAFGFDLGGTDFLAGVFYQRREVGDGDFRFRANEGPTIEIVAAGSFGSGIPLPTLPPLPETGLVEDYSKLFEQTGHAVAGFAQTEWHFAERWTLDYGMRLGWESKKADWNQTIRSEERLLLTAADVHEFTAERSISEFHLQPKVSLNYRPFEEVSLFAHWAKAYRSGGFNAFAVRAVDDELVYGSESAEEWGIDAKTTLLDGAARLNVSLYRMDVAEFQVLARERLIILPIEYPRVINAPKARAQGVEADLTWLATDWLTISGTVGFNDTEYIDFPFGDCAGGSENTDGDANPLCDQTGRPFWLAPQWDNTLTASLLFPLSAMPFVGSELPAYLAEIDWSVSATMEFVDVYYPDPDLDIRKRQRSFFRWRASAGFANPRQGWSFKILGENLTNEAVAVLETDVVPGIFVSIPDASRIVFGQFRWEF